MTKKSHYESSFIPALVVACIAIMSYALLLAGIFSRALSMFIVASSSLLIVRKARFFSKNIPQNTVQLILWAAIIACIAINLPNMLLPDISFDALWYHLPLARAYATTGSMQYPPDISYNALPRLGDILLAVGFALTNSQLGARTISLIMTMLLAYYAYLLSKQFLSPTLAKVVLIVIISSGVVGWQMTAGYTDITSSVFQLSSLLALILYQKHNKKTSYFVLAVFLSSVAIATKTQAILHVISLLVVSLLFLPGKRGYKHIAVYIGMTLMFLVPFALENNAINHHPLYPLNTTEKQIDQLTHAGASSTYDWLSQQVRTLPFIIQKISLNHASHTSPVPLIALPALIILIMSYKSLPASIKMLLCYTMTYLVMWYVTPPPESRYAIAAIVCLVILSLYSIKIAYAGSAAYHITIGYIAISIAINLSVRTYVLAKNMPYIIGSQQHQFILDNTNETNTSIIQKYYYANPYLHTNTL